MTPMKPGRRKLFLSPHFKDRWHERINGEDRQESEGVMRRVLHAALLEKVAHSVRKHYFAVEVRGKLAVFSVDRNGFYAFTTVLERWMVDEWNGEREEKEGLA